MPSSSSADPSCQKVVPTAAAETVVAPDTLNDLALLDQDARTLIEAADRLSQAESALALGDALAHNLKVWIAIQTLAGAAGSLLPDPIRQNLDQLAAYVIRSTLDPDSATPPRTTIETLIRINIQIAEGLMDSQRSRLIRAWAHQMWEDDGRQEGRAMDYWHRAEQDILALLAAR